MAGRTLSRDYGLDRSIAGDKATAREYLPAGSGNGRRAASFKNHHIEHHRPVATVAARRQHKRAISLMQCAAYSAGRRKRRSLGPIRPSASMIPRAPRVMDSWHGLRITSQRMSGAGRWGTRERVWLAVLLYTGLEARRCGATRSATRPRRRGINQGGKDRYLGDAANPSGIGGSIRSRDSQDGHRARNR